LLYNVNSNLKEALINYATISKLWRKSLC
jgi:hypothetical protein